MQTLKFKAQPTNAFFATVNQMFSGSSWLSTTAEHCFVDWAVLNDLISARSAVFRSWEEKQNIQLTVVKTTFVGWALNFRVCTLVKGTVKMIPCPYYPVSALCKSINIINGSLDGMCTDVTCYKPHILSLKHFKFFLQQLRWFLQLWSCFIKWHEKEWSIKLWSLCL